jgi:hypothetical protein
LVFARWVRIENRDALHAARESGNVNFARLLKNEWSTKYDIRPVRRTTFRPFA